MVSTEDQSVCAVAGMDRTTPREINARERTLFMLSPFEELADERSASWACWWANYAFRRSPRAPSGRRRRKESCPLQAARDRRSTCATIRARPRAAPRPLAQDQGGPYPRRERE